MSLNLKTAVIGRSAAQARRSPLERHSLRRNFTWTFAGNLVYAISQWGQLIVLTKLLSPSEVGIFALGLAVSGPVMFLANLGLRTVQVTDASGEYEFSDYLALRIVTSTLGLAIVLGYAIAGGYSTSALLVIVAIGLAKAVDNISDIIHGIFQVFEQMNYSAKGLVLNGVVSFMLVIGLVFATRSVVGAAIGTALGSVIALCAYNLPVGSNLLRLHMAESGSGSSRFIPRWQLRKLRGLVRIAAPLGFAYLLTSLNPNIPRYSIEHFLGSRELGIFAALSYITVVGPTLMGALAQAALPRATHFYAKRLLRPFVKLVSKLLTFATACAVLALVAVLTIGRPLTAIVYTSEYSVHLSLLVWLTIGMGISFIVWFLDVGLSAARKFDIQVPINLIMVVVTTAGALVLVPRFGLVGAAWTICLSLAVQCVCKASILIAAIVSLSGESQAHEAQRT